jgi:hypothetical protein
MAGLLDPFSPGETTDPTAGVDPETYTKVKQEWDSFLGNPNGRAALLSAGLAMMQPPSFGDNATSQIGRAIGAAGESATANQVMGMKQSEQESKADLRSSQALAAEARAGAAEARAGAAGSRLELQGERLKAQNERNFLGNKVKLSGMYQNYRNTVDKNNANPLRTGPPEIAMDMDTWIASNPMLRNMGLVTPKPSTMGSDDEDSTDVPASSGTTTGTPSALKMPTDKAQLKADSLYDTPRGILKWNGTVFVQP